MQAGRLRSRRPAVIRFLDRLVLIAFAMVLAAGAALVMGVAGLFNHDFGQSLAHYAQTIGFTAIASAMLEGVNRVDIDMMIHQTIVAVLAVWLVPVVLVGLLGEVLGRRGWIFYAVGMALAFAVVPMAAGRGLTGLALLYQAIVGLLAMGIVAGTVYWLVAGRNAGEKRDRMRI